MNGDPTVGRQGSIPPAAVFENPQREIVNVISKSQFTPNDVDLQQLTKAIRSQFLNYVQDTGSDSNISVALDPPLTSYTLGLTLRVRIAVTNTNDSVRINAGAGSRFVRRMTGAEVGANNLPRDALATLVFDGTNFQLSNYGGVQAAGAPAPEIFKVNIPYAVDQGTPNNVEVDFPPALNLDPSELAAGDVIAVKIAHTNTGRTMIRINGLTPLIELKPNGGGGGFALQGDLHEGDIVILFFDGDDFWFTPNNEVDAPVTYMIGPSQHFATLADGMQAIRRKAIGTAGHVTFRYALGPGNSRVVIPGGSLVIQHPHADRITVRGTMTAATPTSANFARVNSSASQRAIDTANNLVMARARYGVEITIPATASAYGITNVGPGQPTVADFLMVGPGMPAGSTIGYSGVNNGAGRGIACVNISVTGAQVGFNNGGGTISCHRCYAFGNTYGFVQSSSAFGGLMRCGSYGNSYNGCSTDYSSQTNAYVSQFIANANNGMQCFSASSVLMHWCDSWGNAFADYYAYSSGSMTVDVGSGLPAGTPNPAWNVVGNFNSINRNQNRALIPLGPDLDY